MTRFLKCDDVKTFLSQITYKQEFGPISLISPSDLRFLVSNGYVLQTTKDDYDKGMTEVDRLSQLTDQVQAEYQEKQSADAELSRDEGKEHSFTFRFEGGEEKEKLREKVEEETTAVAKEQSEFGTMEANLNQLMEEKSMIDKMVPYGDGYLSLTDLGAVVMDDLTVRDYRVADEEFSDFTSEIKATYAELRSIADRATSYVAYLAPRVPLIAYGEEIGYGAEQDQVSTAARSLLWSTGIGLGKLQADPTEVEDKFVQSFDSLHDLDSNIPNKLMAAEIMTASQDADVQELSAVLTDLDKQVRHQGVPKEQSAGVAATIMAGRRYDGTYPIDNFPKFRKLTSSNDSAAILSVMNVPFDDLSFKFQMFKSMFTNWGYMSSEDTEIASAFLAIGELGAAEVDEKLKYIVEQLKNYLQYPLVAAGILASIPVFEAHEVLDLMEKAVTLLFAYTMGFERSQQVALAVRMIHGVRNELVKEIDPTAKIADTPVQFTYGANPLFFPMFYPVIIAHYSYHPTFSGMGGFHPAHDHGVGGFAG